MAKKLSPGVQEQRRQTRLAVSQSARMILDSGREIICDIADFCLGGLFLKFAIPEKDGQWIKGQEGNSIRITFTTPVAQGGQDYEFTAKMVRVSESGVGLAFDETPVAAVLALNKVAAAIRSQKTSVKLYGKVDINALKHACRIHLKKAIEDSFANFGELIIPRLEGASASAKSIADQNDLLDALWLIHPAMGDAQYHCLNIALGRLESLGLGKGIDEFGSADLSIVEKEDFEDWLSLTAASNRLEDRFSKELSILELRLEKVYGLALDRKNNPFAPAMICKEIKQAFADVSLPLSARQILYATMQDALSEPLSVLYRTLLEALPEVDAEKKLASPVVRQATYSPGMHESAPRSLGGVANSLMGHVFQSKVAQATGEASGLSAASLNVLQGLFASGKIPVARQPEATISANVFDGLISAVAMEKSVPTEVIPQFQQMEQTLLRLALLDPSYLNNTGHPAHAVLNAMDRLSLLSSDDGKIDDEHILKDIGRWAGRIRNEADKNPGVFEEVRVEIEKALRPLMKERNARIAKLQAALEGWQKTGQANRMVLEQLEQRVAGRKVPAVVLDLFASGWRNYLIRVMLRKGPGSVDEAEAWGVIDKLLHWLNFERPGKPAYQDVQHLLQTVDSHLKLVCPDKDAQDRLLERLTDALLKGGDIVYRAVTSILPSPLANVAAPAEHKAADEAADLFRVGDWIAFSGMPVPLNLIWVGDAPESYVFCNYKGVKKLELSRNEFVQRINSGEARLAGNLELPLMDRSFSSMIDHIHQDLLKQAMADEKAGLVDRREFMRRVRTRLSGTRDAGPDGAAGGQMMGVLDIESLRLLRSRLGPEGYDGLTRAFADHLEKVLDSSLLTRSAEYTFAFMLPIDGPERMLSAGEKIITGINLFGFKWDGSTHTLNANLGLAYSGSVKDPEELYGKADEACVESKHAGRNQVFVYMPELSEHSGHSWLDSWSSRIADILQDGKLFLRCQPIVATLGESSAVSHYEILLGVNPESDEPVNIGEMVAATEQLRRVSEIDQWVVRSVFDWMRQNPGKLEKINGLSINLSGQSINSKTFLEFLCAELDVGDIPGKKLIFEITESAAIDSFVHAERFIRQLRRYGCRFALDDFGVGFSSFSYLRNLKVDYLKIDGSFVSNMSQNEIDIALVSSMHETSRFLGIKTIAEVVENQETLDILKRIGVDYAQGYYTGKPVPIGQLTV